MKNKNSIRILGLVLMLAAGAMVLSGCSSYERDWEAAVAKPLPTNDITGPWKGTWKSDMNQHTGGLRAIVTKEEDGSYYVRYKATYDLIFIPVTFEHDATLKANVRDGAVYFEGSQDLGWLAGGVYEYTGHATNKDFVSKYKSKGDHGAYSLKRPK